MRSLGLLPDGRVIGEPLIDEEGIVYAEIDLNKCIQPRQMHDITGHYNRFDVFQLHVNRNPIQPAHFHDGDALVSENITSDNFAETNIDKTYEAKERDL